MTKRIMKIKILLMLLMCVFFALSSYADCSCFMEENPVLFGEVQTFDCVCTSGTEINQPYNVTWYDEDGNIISIHMGTTPGTANTPFFETQTIYTDISLINATLTGTNLEGQDSAIVVPANSDGPKLPIVIGFSLLALILFYMGTSLIRNKNKEAKIELSLAGVIVTCFGFLVIWGLLWALMAFSVGQSYYDVIKVFFTIYSILFGYVPLVVCLVSGIIVTFLFLGRFYKK